MLPIVLLIPFITGILSLMAWGRPRPQRAIAVVGCGALLTGGIVLVALVLREGIQVVHVGSWPAPYGITLVADVFGALMVAVTGLIGLAGVFFSIATLDPDREAAGYYPLLALMLMGVTGAFLAGDLFNLYVWFEVLLIASFVLMALGGERSQIEGSIKYVTLNLLASSLFLAGAGILYGLTGTLNMAHATVRLAQLSDTGMSTMLAVLFLCSFGIKGAVFPMFFWLPASYHTPPIAVTAVFSGLLTKVGVYAIARTFTLMFTSDPGFTHTLIMVLAGFTMVTGVLGAVAQTDIRRLLSFHIISQIGYLLMGVALSNVFGLAATVFFLVHVIVAKAALFMVGGIVYRLYGTYDLDRLGGIYRASPALSLMFLVPAFALAGLPPLSGFWAKFALVRAGLDAGEIAIVVVALAVSLLTLFSMTKIWHEAFWKEREGAPESLGNADETLSAPRVGVALVGPCVVLGGLTVVMGVVAGPLFDLAMRAAVQLLSPAMYVNAVLGGGG
jgi:multicomponent Na+:H+ antiporter subunit D